MHDRGERILYLLSSVVNDVDPAQFPGSNMDDRVASLSQGQQRYLILGSNVTQINNSGIPVSRALHAATPHYVQITCTGGGGDCGGPYYLGSLWADARRSDPGGFPVGLE